MANLRVELKSGVVFTAPAEVWIASILSVLSESDQSVVAQRAANYMSDPANICEPFHQLIGVPSFGRLNKED